MERLLGGRLVKHEVTTDLRGALCVTKTNGSVFFLEDRNMMVSLLVSRSKPTAISVHKKRHPNVVTLPPIRGGFWKTIFLLKGPGHWQVPR